MLVSENTNLNEKLDTAQLDMDSIKKQVEIMEESLNVDPSKTKASEIGKLKIRLEIMESENKKLKNKISVMELDN